MNAHMAQCLHIATVGLLTVCLTSALSQDHGMHADRCMKVLDEAVVVCARGKPITIASLHCAMLITMLVVMLDVQMRQQLK